MSMLEWAKNEVAIASKRERGDKPEGEWDYGCACYDSAMRAFESLLGDGHSGMSIGFTKNILNSYRSRSGRNEIRGSYKNHCSCAGWRMYRDKTGG